MKEVARKYLKKEDREKRMRWFSSATCDLFLWSDKKGKITRFQFCYDKGSEQEMMIEWSKAKGIRHCYIDDGEAFSHFKSSPLVIPDGEWNPEKVLKILEQESKGIDPKVYGQVKRKILQG